MKEIKYTILYYVYGEIFCNHFIIFITVQVPVP